MSEPLSSEHVRRIAALSSTEPRVFVAVHLLDRGVDPVEVLVATAEGLAADLAATRAQLATVIARTPPAPMRFQQWPA